MSEETSAPVSTETAASAPDTSSAAVVDGSSASAGSGNAPGSGVDAVASQGTPADAAVAAASAKYRILNREFNDQKHAETVLGSEITRARTTQRELAETKKQLEQYQAEINALRAMAVKAPGGAAGQGVSRDTQTPEGPQSFAKELAEKGELDIIAKIFSDPEMGPGHAMYRMAELFDERQRTQIDQIRNEVQGQFEQTQVRSQQERAVARAIGATSTLKSDYPELDPSNQSEEAVEAQQAILEVIKALPQGPQWLATDPDEALRYAAERVRRMNGTPVFAQPPGTSGSPSARAAQAAEMASAGSAPTPLDGSGVPRQRQSGQPETFADRVRRENREAPRVATTPSGRPLGFPAA